MILTILIKIPYNTLNNNDIRLLYNLYYVNML